MSDDLAWYANGNNDNALDIECAIEFFQEHHQPINAAAVAFLRAERDRLAEQVRQLQALGHESIHKLLRLGAYGLHSSRREELHAEALELYKRWSAVAALPDVPTPTTEEK